MPRLAQSNQDDNVIMPEYRDKAINDILDWLASIFGFQVNIVVEVLSYFCYRLEGGYTLFSSWYTALALLDCLIFLIFSNLAKARLFLTSFARAGLHVFSNNVHRGFHVFGCILIILELTQ